METRTLPGLSKYALQDDGQVVSSWKPALAVLSGGRDRDGYVKMVLIDDNGTRRHVRRASLMCEAYHGPRPRNHVVMHLDGSRTNDAPSNLAWGTQSQNCLDKHKHGTAQIWTRNNNTKLTEEIVRLIRSETSKTTKELAAMYGVDRYTIWAARSRKTWAWLA